MQTVPSRWHALDRCGLTLSTAAAVARNPTEEALARKPLEAYMRGQAHSNAGMAQVTLDYPTITFTD